MFITGAIFLLLWIVNFFFKKNSDYSQGLFDLAFATYLVKHVSSGEETGWMARFESLGDFKGDKWQQRQLERQEKAKLKAEEKAAKAAEANAAESDEDSEEEPTEE